MMRIGSEVLPISTARFSQMRLREHESPCNAIRRRSRAHPQWTYDMASDEEVGRQILSTFMQHKVGASGVLRRNIYRCERCRFPARVEQGRRKWLDQDQIARSLHLRPHRSWSCCGIGRWASAEAFSLTRHALIWPESET